jgi:hypothetical protein
MAKATAQLVGARNLAYSLKAHLKIGSTKRYEAVAGVKKNETSDVDNGEIEKSKKIAVYAAAQEFGAPSIGLPARPFLRPTYQMRKDEWQQNLLFEVRRRGLGDIEGIMYRIAEDMMKSIKLTIRENKVTPPDKAATIKAKQRKGRPFPTVTLMDTASLVNRGLGFEVRKK